MSAVNDDDGGGPFLLSDAGAGLRSGHPLLHLLDVDGLPAVHQQLNSSSQKWWQWGQTVGNQPPPPPISTFFEVCSITLFPHTADFEQSLLKRDGQKEEEKEEEKEEKVVCFTIKRSTFCLTPFASAAADDDDHQQCH